MQPKHSDKTFQEIADTIYRHLEAREWLDAKPRSLAISISLEASELLEHYQWQDKPVGNQEALASELADIFIYGFQFAQVTGVDLPTAIASKLAKSAQKYPAERFKGKSREEVRAAWIESKLNHHKEGL